MTGQAAQFVGAIPEHYDQFLGPRIFHGFADDLAGRVAAMEPCAVLELAAGTGILSRRLRDALPPDCSLLASDLNPPMLEQAKRKFQANENIGFESADATNLPYAAASFDAVACQFGVMFFPDKLRSYEEVLRVLKPGGRYLFNVWGSLTDNPFARVTHETVSGFFPDNPPGFYRVPFDYHDSDTIRQSLTRAGFTGVEVSRVTLDSPIPSARDFATGLVFGNPLIDELHARGGDPQQIRAAVAAAIEARLGETLTLQALVIEAGKG